MAVLSGWLRYLSDDVAELAILNVLVYVYFQGLVKRWTRGLCVLNHTVADLIKGLQWPDDDVLSTLASLESRELIVVGRRGGLAIDWIAWRDAYLGNGGPRGEISYLQET